MHHQTKPMKSNKYTIYHEICIYAKSPHPNSVFCLNLEFFYLSHLLEWSKVLQIKNGIRVHFDQCEYLEMKDCKKFSSYA